MGLFLYRVIGSGASGSLQCPSPSGSVDQRSLECPGCCSEVALFEQKISELFAGGNNRSGSDREFLDSVLVVSCAAEDSSRFVGSPLGLGRPSEHFAGHDVDLGCPISGSRCTKPIFYLAQRLGLLASLFGMAVAGESESTRPHGGCKNLRQS